MKYFLVLISMAMTTMLASAQCLDNCEQIKVKNKLVVCKLTSPELRERKATVIESLKKQIQEKKELKNGYAYKFAGSDKTIDELADFIKTERLCCDFFTFNLSISGDKGSAWLEIVGPKGAKDFIKTELEM